MMIATVFCLFCTPDGLLQAHSNMTAQYYSEYKWNEHYWFLHSYADICL